MFLSPESRRIILELARRLKNLDTLWPTADSNEKMTSNAVMYLVTLALVEQGTLPSSALLAEIELGNSKDIFATRNGPRVTLSWKRILDTLEKYAPRSIPLVAHVRETEAVEGVWMAEAVEWIVGLVRGKPANKAAPRINARTNLATASSVSA